MKINQLNFLIRLLFITCFLGCNNQSKSGDIKLGIKISNDYPSYWEYNGKPVLLLGGSDDDSLFQWTNEDLIPHLDEMKSVGANYVRNTMSDRKNSGFEVYPFEQLENGKYDLSRWNNEYWNRFASFLEETKKRDIIVQIEIWDRFDFSRENWASNPYNPINNINYDYSGSGFQKEYPLHPGTNRQPFFYTIPELNNIDVVLDYQEGFVNKMLSISLEYDHVIYCMDNETSGSEEWSKHWAVYLREKAGKKKIYLTEMWDAHDLSHNQHLRTFDHPEIYDFADISQNSWNGNYKNWDEAQKVIDYLAKQPRPVNSVKIYGNDTSPSKIHKERDIHTTHAVSCFFRNIIGGLASSRFHRPPSGLGLSAVSKNCIRSVRMTEDKLKLWEMKPQLKILLECDENEAYVSASPDQNYLVYFPAEGSVLLDIQGNKGTYTLDYLDIENARWKESVTYTGLDKLPVKSMYTAGALVIIKKK